MKKYQPKSIYILTLLISSICILIIHSCKRDQSRDALPPSISEAQKWYESTYPKSITNHSSLVTQSIGGKHDLSQIIKPDWKHTATYNRFGQSVIEMPVDPSAKLNLNLKTNRWVFNKDYSRSYFLLIKDKQTYQAYILTFLADSDYVKNNPGKLAHNTYRKIDPDYSGLVLYFTPKGDYIGGYGYKQGKLVMPETATTQSNGQKIQSVDKGTLKPNTMVADCVDWYQQVTVYYEDGSSWTSEWEYLDTTCTYRDDGSNPGGGSTPPSTPPTSPPPPPPCPGSTCTPMVETVRINNLPPPSDPGDGGTPPPPASNPCTVKDCAPVTIRTDSLAKHFPCALTLIINKLLNNTNFSALVAPFTTTRKPDLTYTDSTLPWNSYSPILGANGYELGQTSYLGRSATVNLNTKMFQNSSQLLIAAAVIHETLHAHINYQIETNVNFSPPANYNATKSWLVSLDYWAAQNGTPSNYRDHFAMLTDYFTKAVATLKSWDGSAHTDKEYAEAMLYGLNTSDFLALPAGSPSALSVEYNALLTQYGLTQATVNAFNTKNLNVTGTVSGTSAKLPGGCTP